MAAAVGTTRQQVTVGYCTVISNRIITYLLYKDIIIIEKKIYSNRKLYLGLPISSKRNLAIAVVHRQCLSILS